MVHSQSKQTNQYVTSDVFMDAFEVCLDFRLVPKLQ